MGWTVEQALALARDPAVANSARELTPSKWVYRARRLDLIWGTYKGSSAEPYMVIVDSGPHPSFSCTCPYLRAGCSTGCPAGTHTLLHVVRLPNSPSGSNVGPFEPDQTNLQFVWRRLLGTRMRWEWSLGLCHREVSGSTGPELLIWCRHPRHLRSTYSSSVRW